MIQSLSSPPMILRGALLGALTGLVVSTLYAGLIIAFLTVMMLFGALTSSPEQFGNTGIQFLIAPAIAGFMIICAGFIGVLPGTILGLLIGLLISLPLALLGQRLSQPGAALVGFLISTSVVLLIHVYLLRSDSDPTLREYLFMTILPGLLCSGAGGWVGWQLRKSIR